MKTKLSRKTKQVASALLTTLVICSILSLFVMYYLSLIDQQNFLNARSQTWNMAIAISEAGIEDGLAQLNNAYPNLATDGWTANGSFCYWHSNSLPDGNSYVAYIFTTNWLNPVVVSRSYVTPPTLAYNQSTSMFAAQGLTPGQSTVTRSVQVTCSKKSPFNGALIAKKNIDLKGNNVSTDSFNSSDPSESTNGQYDPAKYKGDRGDVATDLGVIDSINGGNANIYGVAHTGMNSVANALQVGPNGYVGSHADEATIGSGVDPGHWKPDANFDFPVTTYPNTTSYVPPTSGWITNLVSVTTATSNYTDAASAPSPLPAGAATNTFDLTGTSGTLTYPLAGTYVGAVTTYKHAGNTYYDYSMITGFSWYTYATNSVPTPTYYDHILLGSSTGTNYYVASDLSGQTIVLGSNVVLALPNGLNLSGNDSITLSQGNIVGPTYPPAAITVYSGGTSAAIGGNGIVNQSGYAGDFLLFCAPSVTSLSLHGNGTFSGVVVAPSVDVTLNGGGSNPTDFVGSLLANSITLNGHFNFHYDEALDGDKALGRFLITSWNEIKPF